MEAEKGKVMGIGYLFTKEELELLQKLFRGKRKELVRKRDTVCQFLRKKEAYFGLAGKYQCRAFLAAFVKVMNEPEKKADFEEGILYVKKGLVLWKYADCHTLNGIVLKPYPTMESWFLEEKENLKESMEYYDQALQKKSETL